VSDRSFGVFQIARVAAVLGGIAASISCSSSTSEPWDFVPPNSIAVLHLDWARVQADNALRRVVRDSGIEEALRLPSVKGHQIDTLIAFGELSTASQDRGAVILKGRFDRTTLTTQAADHGYRELVHRGHKMFFDPVAKTYATLMARDIVVVGSQAAVESVIDTVQGASRKFREESQAAAVMGRIGSGAYPVSMLVAVPQTYQDAGATAIDLSATVLSSLGLTPLGVVLEKIGLPGAIGLGLSAKGTEYPVEVIAMMRDEGSATFVAGSLVLLQGLAGILPAVPTAESGPNAQATLRNLVVNRTGASVSVTMTLSEKDLSR
jgi:hypothetical protein